jgi:hypothetical protein
LGDATQRLCEKAQFHEESILTFETCVGLFPVPVSNRVLRLTATGRLAGWEVFPAAPKAVLDAGWEGRPFDEKKLAIFNTGRAFFKGSSDLIALVAFNASACREVDLRRFVTGPVSSADERGRDANVGAAWFRFGHCC